MLKMLRLMLSALVMFSFLSYAVMASSANAVQLAEFHRWNSTEIAALKQLWIGSIKIRTDATNAVSNNAAAARLGHKLFYDKALSSTKKVSCSTCHQPDLYFSDGLKTAKGIDTGLRNTPSIVGVNNSPWYFHDGRADSLWSQALGPLENSLEHGGNRSMFAFGHKT